MDDIVACVGTPELLEGVGDVLLEMLVVPVLAGYAEQVEGLREDVGGEQIVDGREQEALGEIARGTEDGEQAGRDGRGLVGHRLTFRLIKQEAGTRMG